MKLYHYTTIESLAQILKNRTIRFNRLDQVDDVEEGSISPANVRVGQYVFVSCWTKNKEESIPLWNLYTANGRGVRICMDSNMFLSYDNSGIVECDNLRFALAGSAYERTLTPWGDFINNGHIVLPVGEQELEKILKDIQYVENVESAVNNSVSFQQISSNYRIVHINLNDLGRFKHKRWAFEDESRFVILILPGKHFHSPESLGKDLSQWILDVMSNNIPLSISYYDLNLKDDAIQSLEVVLGPSCGESERIIVDALCEKYAPNAVVKMSNLANQLRFK